MEFKVLGPLEVWSDGVRVAVNGRRLQHILAVLLLSVDRVVPIDRLIEAAWEDTLPSTATHQVRKVIGELRRRLCDDELIVTDGPGYRMALGEDDLDLRLFDLRMARANEAIAAGLPGNAMVQLDLGLQLWRGSALSGLGGSVLTPAVLQLNERRLAATEQLIDLRLAAGEAAAVVANLQVLVEQHPLRETLRGQLMLALYRVGRHAEALQAFADARALIVEELGVDPGAQLTRLHERMLRGDTALDVPEPVRHTAQPDRAVSASRPVGPNMLPHRLPDFTGRAGELATIVGIAKSMADHELAIVAIDGMGGVGKTSLALQAAHQVAEHFPDGQLFVGLRGFVEGIEPLSSMDALEQLLRSVGVDGEQISDNLVSRAAMWRVRTSGKRLVIVLDDAVDFAQVEPLLPGAAGCLLLVTSRARIADLDGVFPLSLNPMSADDSGAMISNIIGERRVAGSQRDVTALIEVCGHLPLALRIAAARLHNRPMWTVRDLVHRLGVEERRLDELALGNRRVATAIEMSYQTLPAAHRRLFRRLGLVLGNDVDSYSAAAIAGVPLLLADDMLEDLLDARLLQQPRANRYALHGLLRSYALHAARTEDNEADQREAFVRMLDYYLHTAEAAAAQIHPGRRRIPIDVPRPAEGAPAFGGQAEALAWFDDEQDNLLAAAAHVTKHGPDLHACHLPRVIASYLQIRGRLHNHVDLLHAGVAAADRTGNRLLEMVNLSALSSVFWQLGNYDDAFANMTRALSNAEEIVDRAYEGECLSRIGLLCENTGRYDEALRYIDRALRIHRETGNLFEEGITLTTLCFVQLALGQYELAEVSARTSLTAHRELDHGVYVVSALEGLAAAELGLGRDAHAFGSLDSALRLAQDIGYRAGEAAVMMRYADACRRMGRLDEARSHGMQALEILWTIQRPAVEAEAMNILGVVLRQLGELTTAMAQHTNALEIADRIHCRLQTARALEGIADVLFEQGDTAGAREHWRAALGHYTDMGTWEAGPLRARIDRRSSC